MIDFKNGSFFKLKTDDAYSQLARDLLVDGEQVVGSFKALRDGVITNKRVIAVNV